MKRSTFIYAAALAGLGMVAIAFFAQQLGLDHNARWGPGRSLLLASGLIVLAGSLIARYRERLLDPVLAWARTVSTTSKPHPSLAFVWRHRHAALAGLATLAALAVYIFLMSGGTWTQWPGASQYYDDLANAFQQGHLYLDVQPSAGFLALTDPYEPAARNATPTLKAFSDQVYDLSFYQGKFYMYWGPLPALLLLIPKTFHAITIPDQTIAFGFLAGLLIVAVLLILHLWRTYAADVPFGLALLAILVAALAAPILWMLGNAAIYEASVAAGQFFLVAGMYFGFRAVRLRPASRGDFLVAAAFWALAAASRLEILLPAGFLTIMLIAWEVAHQAPARPSLRESSKALVLALPMIVCVLLLGWYNWTRFGSILETGHKYALTLHNLVRFDSQTVSWSYALPGLWMYLFNPFAVQSRFPFLSAVYGRSPQFLYLSPVTIYHSAEVTGILLSTPFVLFSILTLANTVSLIRKWRRPHPPLPPDDRQGALAWISISLLGSLPLAFGPVLLHYDVRMRFFADFVPALTIVSALGLWHGYRWLRALPARYLYIALAVVLAIVSIAVAWLLTMSESHGRFRHLNPQLLKQLIRFFSP